MNRLFSITLTELDEYGNLTGRDMHTVLSSMQLKAPDVDLERLFELVHGEELKDAVQ